MTIRLGGTAEHRRGRRLLRQRRVITFHGFLKAYVEGSDDDSATDDQETRLPNVAEGDAVSAAAIRAEGHSTKPPARYTEATLIKELEEREIGRPSTYASIIGTILDRGYVYKKGTALVPAWLAFSVIRLLEEHFARLVSYEFTAGMEDILDEIAGGRRDRNTELAEFYFGSGQVEGLKKLRQRARRHRRQGAGHLPDRRGRQRDRPAGRQVRPLPRGPRRRRHPGGEEGQRARRPAAQVTARDRRRALLLCKVTYEAGNAYRSTSTIRPSKRSCGSSTAPSTWRSRANWNTLEAGDVVVVNRGLEHELHSPGRRHGFPSRGSPRCRSTTRRDKDSAISCSAPTGADPRRGVSGTHSSGRCRRPSGREASPARRTGRYRTGGTHCGPQAPQPCQEGPAPTLSASMRAQPVDRLEHGRACAAPHTDHRGGERHAGIETVLVSPSGSTSC